MALKKKQVKIISFSLAGAAALILLLAILFIGHGTIQSKTFCNFCHTQYYDVAEYAYNENVGMEKPSGVLVGCAECHPQPYAEYKKSVHYEPSREELKPGCANCHVPHSVFKWVRYMFYNLPKWQRVRMSIHDNVLWEEEVRPDLARKARLTFVNSKSKNCKECHIKNNNFREDINQHQRQIEEEGGVENVNCIKCHYNLVHAEVDWPDKDEMF